MSNNKLNVLEKRALQSAWDQWDRTPGSADSARAMIAAVEGLARKYGVFGSTVFRVELNEARRHGVSRRDAIIAACAQYETGQDVDDDTTVSL